MTKEQASKRVERLEAEVAEAQARWYEQFCLVDDLESNGEDCSSEREDLGFLKYELDSLKDQLEDAIDYRDNWC